MGQILSCTNSQKLKVYADSNSISSHTSTRVRLNSIDDDEGKLHPHTIRRINSTNTMAASTSISPNSNSVQYSVASNLNVNNTSKYANSHTLSAIKDTALLIKYPARNILPSFLWEAQLILQESEFIRKLFQEFIFMGISNSDDICEWAHYLLELLSHDTQLYGNNNNNYLQKAMSHSLDDVTFQEYILFSKDISLVNSGNNNSSANSSSAATEVNKFILNHPLNDPMLFLKNFDTIKKKMIKCTHLKFKDTLTNDVGVLKPQLSSLHTTLNMRAASMSSLHQANAHTSGNNNGSPTQSTSQSPSANVNTTNIIPGLNGVSPCFLENDLKVVTLLILWILFRAHNKELRGFLNNSGSSPGESPYGPDSYLALGYNSVTPTQNLAGLLATLNKNHPPQVARVFHQILHGAKSLTPEYLEEIMTKGQWVHDVITAIDNLPCSISISTIEGLKNNKKNSSYNNTLSPMESLNLDKTYPIIYVNKQFEKLTLYSRSQILGNSLSLLQNSQLTEWDQLVKLINCLYYPNVNSIKIGITNQRRDNSIFFNFLAVRVVKPLKPSASSNLDSLNFIGIQYDINNKDSSINDLRQIDDALLFLTLLIRR